MPQWFEMMFTSLKSYAIVYIIHQLGQTVSHAEMATKRIDAVAAAAAGLMP